LFSMSHLNEAFLVSSHIKGPSAVSLETLDFSSGHLENDFSIRLFYHEAQTGTQYTIMSKEIVHEASYDRFREFPGMAVRQTRSGDIVVDARPRVIQCSPSTASVHVRSSYIDMGVQVSNCSLHSVYQSRYSMIGDREDLEGMESLVCLGEYQPSARYNTREMHELFQESEKAYVKRGLKRVHVSRSGMVVSDGNCITSMDHFGRIVSST
uniref:TEN4 n=1 Tax=Haemonchus placei TaxID=6290 RepID=A0A0N4VZK5_HAEPC